MKRIIFALFIAFFLTSCEDDINSPNNNDNNILGCTDPTTCNFNPLADINDGTCIYGLFDSQECTDFDDCQLNSNGMWTNHTCLNPEDLPLLNWDGRESSCGYTYQNGGYTYQQAVNDGEPCGNLTENACDESCAWDGVNQICELAFICEDVDGNSLEGWDAESNTATDDCINASVCKDNNDNHYVDWDNTEGDCNNAFIYTPGSCEGDSLDNTSDDDGGADDGGTDDGGADDGGADDGGN